MNNLDRLYEARKELDKVLNEVGVEQSKIKAVVVEKRNTGWGQMFDDLYSLTKYSNFIDTGINLYQTKKETLGFEIRKDEICVISWEHFDGGGRPIEPRKDTYFFTITKDKPFETDSHYKDWMKHVVHAIENWDEVMVEIKSRLAKRMESDMKKKISNAEQRQVDLENQLVAISR